MELDNVQCTRVNSVKEGKETKETLTSGVICMREGIIKH